MKKGSDGFFFGGRGGWGNDILFVIYISSESTKVKGKVSYVG